MAEHPTCQHYHRVELDQTTRGDVESKFEDLDPSAGFMFNINGLLKKGPPSVKLSEASPAFGNRQEYGCRACPATVFYNL